MLLLLPKARLLVIGVLIAIDYFISVISNDRLKFISLNSRTNKQGKATVEFLWVLDAFGSLALKFCVFCTKSLAKKAVFF